MFNPSSNGAAKSNSHKKAVAEVSKWVSDAIVSSNYLTLNDFQVMVTEIQCNEPDCVPIETLVIVMLMKSDSESMTKSKGALKWADKLLKPVAEVTKDEIAPFVKSLFEPAEEEELVQSNELDDVFARKRNVDSFEIELSELVKKYQALDKTAVLQALTTQLNSLRNDALPAVPHMAEPVRTVTAVTMKSNAPSVLKSVPLPTPTKAHVITTVDSTTVTTATSGSAAPASHMLPKETSAQVTGSLVAPPSIQDISLTPTTGPPTSTNTTDGSSPPAIAAVQIKMASAASVSTPPAPIVTYTQAAPATIAPRHKKGSTRPRGCPCCDPDNLDNIIDSMMFSHYPQT